VREHFAREHKAREGDRSIFEMTRLIKQIAVYEDRDEAISSWE
jgi:hypothetical protein